MRQIPILILASISLAADIIQCCEYSTWNPLLPKNHHFAVLILARGGSKGIKLKNLSKVGNNSLLAISIREAKKLQGINSVWVSTDHAEIAREAEKENAKVHWRSPDSATDEATSFQGINDFLQHHPEVDVVGLVQCTSPFVKSPYLQKAVDHMKAGKDCSFAGTRSYKLRWKKLPNELVPLNFDPSKRPRRQNFDGELVENGMFYFFTTNLIKRGVLQSNKNIIEKDGCTLLENGKLLENGICLSTIRKKR